MMDPRRKTRPSEVRSVFNVGPTTRCSVPKKPSRRVQRHDATNVTHTDSTQEPESISPGMHQDIITISLAKYKALHGLINQKCSFLDVKVVSVAEYQLEGKLTLEGPVSALQQAKLSIFEELMNVEEQLVDAPLSPELSQYLQSTQGEEDIAGRFAGLRAQVVQVSGQLCIVGHVDDCSKALDIIRNLLHTEVLDFPAAKYKALEQEIKERCEASYIRILSSTPDNLHETIQLTIEAPKSIIDEFRVFFKGRVLELEERPLQLNSEKSGFLRTPKGKAKLADILHGLNVQVVTAGGQLVCVGSDNGCTQAVTLIERVFRQETVVCPLAKYIVLEDIIIRRCPSLHARVISVSKLETERKAHVVLEAKQEVLEEAKVFIYETLMSIDEQRVPPAVECFLRDNQIVNIDEFLKIYLSRYVRGSTSKNHVRCVDIAGQLTIVGKPVDCLEIRKALTNKIFMANIKIEEYHRAFLETDAWKASLEPIQKEGLVHVEVTGSTIELEGTESSVKGVQVALLEILRSTNPNTKHMNRQPILQAKLEEQFAVPPYWSKNTGETAKLIVRHNPSKDYILVNVDSNTREAVTQLVKGTWNPTAIQSEVSHPSNNTSSMYNSRFRPPMAHHTKPNRTLPQNFSMQDVQRIENPAVYQEYSKRMRLAREEGSKATHAHITNIQEDEVVTATLGIAELDEVCQDEVNEYFLFLKSHLTGSLAHVDHFVTRGIKGMGKSVTLTENAAEAISYRGQASREPYHLVVCRVILGHIYRHQPQSMQGQSTKVQSGLSGMTSRNARPQGYPTTAQEDSGPAFTAPPCRVPGCHSDSCSHEDRFSSVMIKTSNHREFLLFDHVAVYPEYLVTLRL